MTSLDPGWEGSLLLDFAVSAQSPSETRYVNMPGGYKRGPPKEGEEMVEVADKSCKSCRERKVRCDRVHPQCMRCTKRDEVCVYDRGYALSLRPISSVQPSSKRPRFDMADSTLMPPPPPEQQRPALPLLSPIAQDDTPLSHYPTPSPSYSDDVTAIPYPVLPSPNTIHLPPSSEPSPHQGAPAPPFLILPHIPYPQEAKDPYRAPDLVRLWDSFLTSRNIGHRSLDWQLAQPAMATSLTTHLLEASVHSCCFHLRAFSVFKHRIPYFRSHLDDLDPSSRAAVTILASLGARASPHSAVLGVSGPDIEDGNATFRMNHSAGMRRESAWRAIMDMAVDQCSRLDIANVASATNIETLVAVTNALLFSEVRPTRSRFFLRAAVGLFQDYQLKEVPPSQLAAFNIAIGPTLYEADARIAAYAGVPFLLSEDDLADYFSGTGIVIPDLRKESLSVALDSIFAPSKGPVVASQVAEALLLAQYFVSSAQRTFAQLTTGRGARSFQYLTGIHEWWSTCDQLHGALQKLYRLLQALPPDAQGSEHDWQNDLLLCVRLDVRVVDLFNLAHAFLQGQQTSIPDMANAPVLANLLDMSEKRVRRCLKLTAYYANLFRQAFDKHILYHLFTQLEVLPWVRMVSQRVGERDGPETAEYEVSEAELDWFTHALEVACFYSPTAADRLTDLDAARQARRQPPSEHPAFGADFAAPAALPTNSLHAFRVHSDAASPSFLFELDKSPGNEEAAAAFIGGGDYPRMANTELSTFTPAILAAGSLPPFDDRGLWGHSPKTQW